MPRCSTRTSGTQVRQHEPKDLFTSLPPELIEMISAHLDRDDVLAFRLTCPYLAACSERAFADTWIAERPFMLLNKGSIRMLTTLVNDPRRRRQLKCLNIALATLPYPHEDFQRRKYWSCVQDPEQGRKSRVTDRSQRVLYLQRLEEQNRLYDDEDNGSCQILREAVAILQAHQIDLPLKVTHAGVPCIGLTTGWSNFGHAPAWRYGGLCRELGYARPLTEKERNTIIFRRVLNALSEMTTVPSVLELGNVTQCIPTFAMIDAWFYPALEDDASLALANVTSLRVCLTLDSFLEDDPEEFQELFYTVLCRMPHLRTLGLTVGNGYVDDDTLSSDLWFVIYNYDDPKILRSLQQLELNGLTVPSRELFKFLERHEETLRKVHLSWIKQEESVFPDVQDRLSYNMVGSAHTWFRLYCCMVAGFPKVQFTAWQHVYDGMPWNWAERSKGPRDSPDAATSAWLSALNDHLVNLDHE